MTRKKVLDIDALIASDDVEAIMAKYIQLSVQVKKLRDRLMREPAMSEIVGGLLPQQAPAIPVLRSSPGIGDAVMGTAPWNPIPPVLGGQLAVAPLIPGMQPPTNQVPQEGVVSMGGTSITHEFPLDEYNAAQAQQNVMSMLAGYEEGGGPS